MNPAFDEEQARKAIAAIYKWSESKNTNDLLENERNVFLQVTSKHIMKKNTSASVKPKKIQLKFSPYPDSAEACLIVKNDEEKWEEKIKNDGINWVTKVVSVKALKGMQFEEKRKLTSSYELFLVDDRVQHAALSVSGGIFVKKNKYPAPVRLSGDIKAKLEKALITSYSRPNTGVCHSTKIGHLGMGKDHVYQNLLAALPKLVEISATNWTAVQNIGVQAEKGPMLPLYSNNSE
ncbi:Ribosomal L1 domain-containing protein 1 [Apophysomyces sp. BC1034]|nr:Ribosomal L1 domain-containing protein 1 [Apophysomyces sp. BC1015]KAG0182081.1 Ribosomal L1 domain-containing protein 1 [Apophysomyces sp. BC1021]KAG0192745.1 Ribosomal L1 domain-containing protein 1 [Apophysomyces sp. BC1034]